MCGWPVGVAFPAQDSELEAHAAEQSATSEVEEAVNEEQAGAQLDALSTMVDRQAEATAPPEAPPVEAVASAEESVEASVESPELVMATAEVGTVAAGAVALAEPESAPDQLSAPVEETTDNSPRRFGRRRAGPPADEHATDVSGDVLAEAPVEEAVDEVSELEATPVEENETETVPVAAGNSDRQLALIALLVAVLALVVAGASFVL